MNLIKRRLQNCFLDDHWTQSFIPKRDKSDRKTAVSATSLLSILTKNMTKEMKIALSS